MKNSLSIRTYTKRFNSHVHAGYHQLVLPIQGNIHIDMNGFVGRVTVGECVVIPKSVLHGFNADEAARFIVADLDQLPSHLISDKLAVFQVSPPLLSFIHFVDKQLLFQVDSEVEASMLTTFALLLKQQELAQALDPRIHAVQVMINEQLADSLTINSLAEVSFLSPTQFKKLFKENIGMSPLKYITEKRMEKAKALLTHTDLPVHLIAERVGYSDLSAFSRRFSTYFGISPREFARC